MTDVPIRSGNALIDGLFNLCVRLLLWGADLFGMSYNTINIWVFCIIWPLFTLALIVVLIRQGMVLREFGRGFLGQKRG